MSMELGRLQSTLKNIEHGTKIKIKDFDKLAEFDYDSVDLEHLKKYAGKTYTVKYISTDSDTEGNKIMVNEVDDFYFLIGEIENVPNLIELNDILFEL